MDAKNLISIMYFFLIYKARKPWHFSLKSWKTMLSGQNSQIHENHENYAHSFVFQGIELSGSDNSEKVYDVIIETS